MAEYNHFPIFSKLVDVPEWMKTSQTWQNAVPLDKLQKHQMKVKMCCAKCEEKVVENIREAHGVFDVRAERFNSKVVVVSLPPPVNLSEHEVLRRARKVDKKAKFVELDAKERPKTEEEKKKEAEEAKKKKEAEEAKKKKEAEEKKRKEQEAAASNLFRWTPPMVPLNWSGPFYGPPPQPGAYYPGEFFFQMEEEKKKQEEAEKKKKKKEEEQAKKKEQEAAASHAGFMWYPNAVPWGAQFYPPYPYRPEEAHESRPSQWYAPRYHYPPLTFQNERDEFSRPYYYY